MHEAKRRSIIHSTSALGGRTSAFFADIGSAAKRNWSPSRFRNPTLSCGSFRCSLQLPFAPDPDQVRANFKDGILTIALPKQGRRQKSRRIEIGSAAAASD